MPRRNRLATAVTSIILTAAASAGDFIRVEEDNSAARLQTAITRFEKDGKSVELIGAVHIADKAYYQALVARFASYDSLLFEMVGGEKPAAKKEADEAAAAKNLSGLHRMHEMAARLLGLVGQTHWIDYGAKNFVHADLTAAEFTKLQAERGESLVGFAIKAGLAAPKPKHEPNSAKLLMAMIAGDANLVKLEIVHTLGQGDDQVSALTGESVIITDRNIRCLEVMQTEHAAGRGNLGIFYGAAHFPDMEKRLLEMGFQRTKQEWLTAWDIPKAAKKPAALLENAF